MSAIYATRIFEKLIDKATNSTNLEPDWTTILQVCDSIRQNDIKPKNAILAVKRKLHSQNPHQVFYTLLLLESMMKNCGPVIHDEVATKAFCETLHERLKATTNDRNKIKMLELIQAWAVAFRKVSKYRPVQDLVNIIKSEGYLFPTYNESEAMFSAQAAPKFLSGDICHRCRVPFSLILRRHHCRACGQPFCQHCTPNTTILPQFGIEKEVRVCENCYDKYATSCSSNNVKKPNFSLNFKPKNNIVATKPTPEVSKRTEELKLQQEEDLQLAIALSKSEAEQRERRSRSFSAKTTSRPKLSSPKLASRASAPSHAENSEMNRYLDRKYWEKRAAAVPTAPQVSTPQTSTYFGNSLPVQPPTDYDDLDDKEIDKFIEILRSQIEIFINRMKSDSSRGRHISNDSSVQGLFLNITAMHSKLLQYIEKIDDKRSYLESLQDKVSQVRDSRAALDLLRTEHTVHMAAVQKAALSVKQSQMAAKLALLRQKKQEYLQYQRQLALQRVHEHEREMQMRQQQSGISNNHYLISSSLNQMPNNYLIRAAQGSFTRRNMTDLVQNEQPSVSRLSLARSFIQREKLPMYAPQITNAHNCARQNYKEATIQSESHVAQKISQPNVRSTMSQQMQNSDLAHQTYWVPYQQAQQLTQNVGGEFNQNTNMCQQNCNLLQQEEMRNQNINQNFSHNMNSNCTNAYDHVSGVPNYPMPMNQQNPSHSIDISNRQMSQFNPFQTFDTQQPRMPNYGMRLVEPSNLSTLPNQIMQDQNVNTPSNFQTKNVIQIPRECAQEQHYMNGPAQNQNQSICPSNIRSKSDAQALHIFNQNIAKQDLQGNYQISQQLPEQNVLRQQFSKDVPNPQSNFNLQQNVQPNDIANVEPILKKHKTISQRNLGSQQNSLTQQQNILNSNITSQGNANLQQCQQNNSKPNREKSSCNQQNCIQQMGPNSQHFQTSSVQGYLYQIPLTNNPNPDHNQVIYNQPAISCIQETQICPGQQNILPSPAQDHIKTQATKTSFVQPQAQVRNPGEQHTIPRIQLMQTCGMPPILQILNNAQDLAANATDQTDQVNVNQTSRQQPVVVTNQQKTSQNSNSQSIQIDKSQIPTQNTMEITQAQTSDKPQNQQVRQASTTRLQQGTLMKMQSHVRSFFSKPDTEQPQPQQIQHSFQTNDQQNINNTNNAGIQNTVMLVQERQVNTEHNSNTTNQNNNS